MNETVVRFTGIQRAEHAAVMTLFTLLAITGLPQKFFDQAWAQTLMGLLGGVDAARWIHRMAGVLFTLVTVVHLARLTYLVAAGRTSLALVPTRQDFRDAITTLRYYLGLSDHHAKFDRFDYKQKFEYWGMILGSLVVVITGLILLYPIEITQWLPGALIPIAVVAHSNEGLLAFLTIITWHIFNACLTPEVFPIDTTIFTGRISEERMRHEHPLEYERLVANGQGASAPNRAA